MTRHEEVVPQSQQATVRELEGAWLRAVAIVWSDPAKLLPLKRDPKQFLHTECGYDAPASLALTVREAQESGGSWRWHMRSPPQGEVILEVPPPPELSEQPVALAELASAFALVPLCIC
jgi:hypothetical protein